MPWCGAAPAAWRCRPRSARLVPRQQLCRRQPAEEMGQRLIAAVESRFLLWVEFEPLNCNISSMTPLEKCLQTLRALIDVGDVQAISSAERAIDEFVACHEGRDRQTEALEVLDREVASRAQHKPDRSFELLETILGYIDGRVQELRKGE